MRASIVLGVIAALLLGYILVFERGTLGTRETEQRAGTVLPELIRAKISRIEIQRKNVTTVLARNLDAPEEREEEGLWHVEAPYKAEADTEAVDTLLGDLEWLHGARTLTGIKADERKRFGLDAPRARLWFTVGSVRVPVRLGSETPQGDGVYVETNAKDTVFVVGKDFAESLAQPPEHFHTKVLHEGVLVSTARKVSVRDESGERVANARGDDMWSIAGAEGLLASTTAIGTFIDALDGLRASRFVEAKASDLARYGLQPAVREIELHKKQFSLEPVDGKTPPTPKPDVLALRLRVGKPCEGHEGERYLIVGDQSTVFCAHDADLDKLKLPLAELQERHFLPIEPDGIQGVKIEREGTTLELTRADEAWSFALRKGTETLAQGSAREGSVHDFLQALRTAEATDLGAHAQIAQTARATVVTFTRTNNKPALIMRVAPDGMTDALVQRADEPHPVAFASSLLQTLEPSTAPFRALKLLSLAESSLTQLEITRGAVVERLARENQAAPLDITEPLQSEADRIAAGDVLRLLSGLIALRFAADTAEPEHGLASPLAVVRARYAKQGDQAERSVVLRVGASTEGGRFASLEGERGVFVISAQLADLLLAPLLSRTLLSTPLEDIAAIELKKGAQRVRVQRNGEAWDVTSSPASGAKINADAAKQVPLTIATLRAQTVESYGGAPVIAPYVLDVLVERRDGSRRELRLRLGEGGVHHARRSDLAADFVLTETAAKALLAPFAAP